MNNRFPALSFISTCLKIIGWIFVVFGLMYIVAAGLIEPNMRGHSFNLSDIIDIVTGLGILISGLVAAAFGETIGVLFAIEYNTRREADSINENSRFRVTKTLVVVHWGEQVKLY